MGNIVKPTLILAMIVFFASFALSHINRITIPSIKKQEKQKQETALSRALPGYTIKEEKTVSLDGAGFVYWVGEKNQDGGVITGYAFIAEKSGYSGPVKTIVGMNEGGVILGISIVQQTETPGLGARCIEVASRETFIQHFFGSSASVEENHAPWFQEQFRGIDTTKKIALFKKGDWNPGMRQELMEKNGISAITGATITTRAVKDSIEKATAMLRRALETAKPASGAEGK